MPSRAARAAARPSGDPSDVSPGAAVADPITKAQIKKLPVVAYDAVRAQLRSGDLLFCSGSYLFSGLIQRFTRSVWSHVGIVYIDDRLQRAFVLESETAIGVRLAPVSKYLSDYHGRRRPYRGTIAIARVHPGLDEPGVVRAISFGMDELTRPYDNFEILRIALRILFRIGRRTRDRKYICSELVDECFRKAGIAFRRDDNYISPDHIWKDPAVQLQFRIL
jgi:cell wall-associated NlpC family hydrolase